MLGWRCFCYVPAQERGAIASSTWFRGRFKQVYKFSERIWFSCNSWKALHHLSAATALAQEVFASFSIATCKVKPIAEKGQSGEVDFEAAVDGDYFFHVGRPGSVIAHISGGFVARGNRQTCVNYGLIHTWLSWLVGGEGVQSSSEEYVGYVLWSMQTIPGETNDSTLISC